MRTIIRFYKEEWNSVALATAVLLVFAFFLGGASRLHELRLAVVELAALPALVLALTALSQHRDRSPSRLSLGILLAVCAVPLIQLIPLPPALWSSLPGRDQLALSLDVAGLDPSWVPLSFTPDRTWRSFLALIPPAAVFLGVVMSGPTVCRELCRLLLGGVVLAALLGAAQLGSSGRQFYLWPTTDTGNVVGFLANRNHFASLCLLSLPFAAAFGGRELRRQTSGSQMALWLSALFMALIIVTLGVIRSRFGVALAGPVLVASLATAWVAAGRGRPSVRLIVLVSGAAVALAAIGMFALGPILQRFDASGAAEGRFKNWPIIAEAANTYLPLGSGLGSFDAVFRSVEPLATLDSTFFNQAHNDYLETWLETGWFGISIVGAFMIWFARRSWLAWRAAPGSDNDLVRAATIAIGVLLAHSLVDYPLRTETLATLFALFCAIIERAGNDKAQPNCSASSRRRRRS